MLHLLHIMESSMATALFLNCNLERALHIQPGVKLLICVDSLAPTRLALSGLPKRLPKSLTKGFTKGLTKGQSPPPAVSRPTVVPHLIPQPLRHDQYEICGLN